MTNESEEFVFLTIQLFQLLIRLFKLDSKLFDFFSLFNLPLHTLSKLISSNNNQ